MGILTITAILPEGIESIQTDYVPKMRAMRTANLEEVKIVARNNPFHHYSGGSKDLTLTLDIHADDVAKQKVIRTIEWLESLAMADGYAGAQPRVVLTMGRFFRPGVTWYVASVESEPTLHDETNGYLPRQASVVVQLKEETTVNTTRNDLLFHDFQIDG